MRVPVLPLMLRHRIYYGLSRSFLDPFGLEFVDGLLFWKREQVRDVWPIMPASERVARALARMAGWEAIRPGVNARRRRQRGVWINAGS